MVGAARPHLGLQDWDAVAKKDHLSLMQTEILRLEALIKEIHDEMVTMRTREEEMRNLNGMSSFPLALLCGSRRR